MRSIQLSENNDDSPTKLHPPSAKTNDEQLQYTPILRQTSSKEDQERIAVGRKGYEKVGKKQKNMELHQLSQELLNGDILQEQSQNTKVEVDLFHMIKMMAKSKQFAAIGGLLGAFLMHLIVGAIYRWNMVSGYVGVYFNNNRQTPVGAPLAMLCVGLTMRIGYTLSQKIGSRLVLAFAVLMAFISNIISSQVQSFEAFLLFHNVLFGLSAGLMFLPPIQECHKFFPNLKLITNSIILTGTGLGAVMFGAINIQCIQNQMDIQNITDQTLNVTIKQYFGGCMIEMSIVVLLVGVIGVCLMNPMIIQNEANSSAIVEQTQFQIYSHSCRSQCQSFQSRVFWLVGAMIFLSSCGNYYVIANFKNLLSNQNQQKGYLYWVLISGALGNGLSRLLWGFAFSRIGFKILFCVATLLNIISFLVIMLTNNKAAFIIFYTFNSISLGGFMVIIPNVCQVIFGKKIGQSIYSYYWVIFSLSNFFQFGITLMFLRSSASSVGYSRVLAFFILCVSASIFICYKYTLQGPWKNSLDLVQFKRSQIKKQDK